LVTAATALTNPYVMETSLVKTPDPAPAGPETMPGGSCAIAPKPDLNTTQLPFGYLLTRNFVTTVTAGLGIYLGR